ncbi:MAG: hypothetical protein LBL41_01440 [Bifidobacteriaceae bacterium]|jgi:CYTH domain-containing protein|nr:hypothetical protein [Bifidobacteriaceae bacterium]
MQQRPYGDFEFERRFFVNEFPEKYSNGASVEVIVQSYYVAKDGYNLRVRATAKGLRIEMNEKTSFEQVLNDNYAAFTECTVTIKGPMNAGTRYEAEREVDPSVAIELIKADGHRIIKNRYSVWIGNDGWAVDEFGAENYPLIIAECERLSPVTDLQIPAFCVTEITENWDFANDALSIESYKSFSQAFLDDIQVNGPKFLKGFGNDQHI